MEQGLIHNLFWKSQLRYFPLQEGLQWNQGDWDMEMNMWFLRTHVLHLCHSSLCKLESYFHTTCDMTTGTQTCYLKAPDKWFHPSWNVVRLFFMCKVKEELCILTPFLWDSLETSRDDVVVLLQLVAKSVPSPQLADQLGRLQARTIFDLLDDWLQLLRGWNSTHAERFQFSFLQQRHVRTAVKM